MPVSLLRADNNLPPWRPGLKEVLFCFCVYTVTEPMSPNQCLSGLVQGSLLHFSYHNVCTAFHRVKTTLTIL